MGCEICGRGSCTRSFHSLEEQSSFDDVADSVKENIKSSLERQANRLSYEEVDGNVYVKLEDVIDLINNI